MWYPYSYRYFSKCSWWIKELFIWENIKTIYWKFYIFFLADLKKQVRMYFCRRGQTYTGRRKISGWEGHPHGVGGKVGICNSSYPVLVSVPEWSEEHIWREGTTATGTYVKDCSGNSSDNSLASNARAPTE